MRFNLLSSEVLVLH